LRDVLLNACLGRHILPWSIELETDTSTRVVKR